MKKLMEEITEAVKGAFEHCGYSAEYGLVTVSDRPDLCQFQCSGALMAAKRYRKAPFAIAGEIADRLNDNPCFQEVACIMPGFINITLNDNYIVDYLNAMLMSPKFGCEEIGRGKTVVVDYGGANLAKPLHVGHLRSAVIGESMKRIGKYLGYHVLGDVHLGDWGLPIGLIITELKRRKPGLVYFDPDYKGEYPSEAPFDISELEEIYPAASSYAKTNPAFMEEAKQATYQFQNGRRGYHALWRHILNVSIQDLEKNYADLNVFFELWMKESDVRPYIPEMIEAMKDNGLAYVSDGALVVDVMKEGDTKEIPPCILVKSDGSALYSTTDLATIVQRMEQYDPNEIIYIVDKRQELYFEQVFRCARKANLVSPDTKLTFLGFGTMNGKDGKPFKTRDGGVMRLEHLIKQVSGRVYEKVSENKEISEEEAMEISKKVGLAALKYSDLSNQITKDYIFELDRFTSFEGNTGPYIIYTAVRIKSIWNKFQEKYPRLDPGNISLHLPFSETERSMMLRMAQFNEMLETSCLDDTPHRICRFIYELSNDLNRFYHDSKIIQEPDIAKQLSWIKLITLVRELLITCLDLLGIQVPDRM